MKYFMLTPLGAQLRMHDVRPLLEKFTAAHPDGTFTVEGIIAKFYTGEWTCWIVGSDFLVGPVLAVAGTYGFLDMKGLLNIKVVFIAGNERGEWWHLWDRWVEEARQAGARRIEIVGRKGLSKVLTGFTKELVVMTRDLEPVEGDVQPNVNAVGRA